ncbi:MAG: hypothetical protein AAB645_02380 [Patescibacteria group bacterium]
MKTVKIFIVILAAFASFAVGNYVLAQGNADIQYPVAELGNCSDKSACKTYCDSSAHAEACLAFAEKNNLMSQSELKMARKMSAGEISGPGGCTSQGECEAYCDSMSNIEECVAFAEKNNLMPASELAEAKKVSAAVKQGIKPPACGNKKACDSYCQEPSHMEECINFAMKAGMMKPEEQADAQKMLEAVKKGVKPPACKGKEACDAYCQTDEHFQECADFALAAGMMDQKDYEMAKKTKGKGPGNCKGKEECEAFCKNPANQQTCMNFAKENGLISPEELQRMEEGNKKFQSTMQSATGKLRECLQSKLGPDLNSIIPNQETGDAMKSCYEQFPSEGYQDGPNQGGPRGGPGGCQSPQECDAYCKDHQKECANFGGSNQGPRDGQPNIGLPGRWPQNGPGGQGGPGGCQSEQECQAYCQTHQEECRKFGPGGNQGPNIEPPRMSPPPDGGRNGGTMPQQPPSDGQMPPTGQVIPLSPTGSNGQMPPPPSGGSQPPSTGSSEPIEQAPQQSQEPQIQQVPQESAPPAQPTSYQGFNLTALFYGAITGLFQVK